MDNAPNNAATRMAQRFRGFLPVVVDVETGGFNAETDALLEIAVVTIGMDNDGFVHPQPAVSAHVDPFPGANIDPRSLEITGIDPSHPFRGALAERAALDHVFAAVRQAMRNSDCQRAILVGHNAAFDLGFLNAAVRRTGHKRNPFHPFSSFDTATLGGLAYGQTVLSKAVLAAGQAVRDPRLDVLLLLGHHEAEAMNGVRLHWKGRVDDYVELNIQGNRVRSREREGSQTLNEQASFSNPLPRANVTVSVRKRNGRGRVSVVQQPSQSNNYTAIVKIDDDKSGADDYEIEMEWR